MNSSTRKYLGTSVLAAALFLASGIPALARNSRTVTISHEFVLGGTSLPAGEYTVRWETHSPQATIEFVQRNKVVLSTEGRLEQRSGNFRRNTVLYSTASDGRMSLSEIRLGSGNVLVFNQ